jgi:hypothetical protein
MANSKPDTSCRSSITRSPDHPIERPHPFGTFYPPFIHFFGEIYASQEARNLYLDSISLAGIRVSSRWRACSPEQ